jgi:Sec-independent protein secretion pathway component TatC
MFHAHTLPEFKRFAANVSWCLLCNIITSLLVTYRLFASFMEKSPLSRVRGAHRLVFSYEILTPAALNFFVSYAEGAVESLWSIDQYFEFVLVLMLSTGLSFQVTPL